VAIQFSPELAELCGIHVGDGYLRGKDHRKELDISGNIEERDYYDRHVKKLIENIFKISIKCKLFQPRNTYGFVIRNEQIIEFLHELGFPYGNKSTIIKVPNWILKSKDKNMIAKFLRGLFDTDGCLHFWKRNKGKYTQFKKDHNYYPIIKFTTVSKSLAEDIITLLKKLNFGKTGFYSYKPKKKTENIKYTVTLYGTDKTNRFFEIIGSKNPVKLSRFELWKKIGYCPANSTLVQRLEMLKKAV
jgi:intein/homing endonuclease